jgi:hypothetical protein
LPGTTRGRRTRPKSGSTLLQAAPFAHGLDFERAGEEFELAKMWDTLDERVDLGHLDVLNPPAANAKYMMMRFNMAVIARTTMKRSDLARLADLAKLFENPMHSGQ